MDYIGQLCRAGKVEATQVGRVWFVTEDSLMGYKAQSEELAQKRHQEQSAFSKSIYPSDDSLLPKLTKRVQTGSSKVNRKIPHQLSFSDSLSRAFLSLMLVGSAAVGIFTLGDATFPETALAELGATFTGVYRDIASVPKKVAKNISGGLEVFDDIAEKKPVLGKLALGVKESLFKGNEPLLALGFVGGAADVAQDSLATGIAKATGRTNNLALVPGSGFVKKLFSFFSNSADDAGTIIAPTILAQVATTSDLLSGAKVPVLTVATSTGRIAKTEETMNFVGAAPRVIERVINNTVTNNTVERVLVGEVTRAELDARLTDIYGKIQNQLSALGTGSGGSVTNIYQSIAQTQKIDTLSNVTITNPTISGGNFTNITVSGGSVSSAPSVSTAELTVTGVATSSFAGGINLTSGCFAVNGVCLTSGGGGGGGTGTVNSGLAGQVAYFDADGTTVSGTSTVFILQNGNVGIGTTTFTGSHAGKLVIDQTHDAQTVLRVANYSDTPNAYSEVSVKAGGVASYLGSTPQNSSVITGAGSAGRGYVWSQSTGANRGLDLVAASADSDLRFFTGGTAASNERMTITSTGNVGIGTTSPTSRLSVSSVSTATTTFALRPILGQTANIMDVYSTGGVLTSVIDSSGRFGIGTTTPASSLTVAGGLSVGAGIGVAAPTNGIVTQGNVGIGTANPASEFPNSWGSGLGLGVLSSSNTATIGVRSRSSTGYVFFDQTNDVGRSLLFGTYGSSYTDGGANTWFGASKPGNSFMLTYLDSSLSIGTFGNRNLTLGTNNLARMTVLGGGNVGIGTTTPTSRLEIADAAPVLTISSTNTSVSAGATYGDLNFYSSDTTAQGVMARIRAKTNDQNLGGDGELGFWTYNGGGSLTEKMRLTTIGRLGVGTTTPSAFVHITNTSASPSFLVEDSASVDSTPFIIDASGNVGIGTTTPDAILSIGGAGLSTDFRIGRTNSTNFVSLSAPAGTNLASFLSVNGNNALAIAGTGATNGYVGIGTTTPTDLLNIYSTSRMFGTGGLSISNNSIDGYAYTMYSRNRPSGLTGGAVQRIQSNPASGVSIFETLTNTAIGPTNTATSSARAGFRLNSNGGGIDGAYAEVLRFTGGLSTDAAGVLEPQIRFTSIDNTGNSEIQYGKIGALVVSSTTGAFAGDLTFYSRPNAGLTERMRITSSGNVGIGTTTPYAALSVAGASGIVAEKIFATSTTATSTISGNLVVGNQTNNGIGVPETQGITLYGDINLWGGARTIRGSNDVLNDGGITIIGGTNNFNSQGGSVSVSGGVGGGLGAGGNVNILGGNASTGMFTSAGSVFISGGLKSGVAANVIIASTTGNLGVGSSTPGAKFGVQGHGLFSGNLGAANITATGTIAILGSATSSIAGGLSVGSVNSLAELHVSAQAPNNPVAYFVNTNTGANDEVLHLGVGAASAGTSNLYVSFYQGSTDSSRGTRIGFIQGTGSNSVTYNTTSDVRLKENVHDTSLGLEDLLKIGVKDYNFVTSPGKTVQGFIAQDLNKIYPYAVATTDDGVSPLGINNIPWGVDYGRITPLIVKSIQDQYALYKKLEGRVAEIEARIASSSLTTVSNAGSGGFSMDSVISVLQSAGLSLVNGVTSVKDLVAETATVGSELKPTGITLYDKQTGQPYCLEISNGSMVQTPGKCAVTLRNPNPVVPPPVVPPPVESSPEVSTSTDSGAPVASSTAPVNPPVEELVPGVASSTVISPNEVNETNETQN